MRKTEIETGPQPATTENRTRTRRAPQLPQADSGHSASCVQQSALRRGLPPLTFTRKYHPSGYDTAIKALLAIKNPTRPHHAESLVLAQAVLAEHVKAQPLVVAEGRPKHGAVPPQQTTAEPKQHCRPELIPNDCHGKELRTTRLYAPCCSRHLQLGKAATQGSQGGGPQHKVG